MKINCIIIEDEHPAIEQLEEYISRVPFLALKKSFDNGIEPINFLKSNRIDLIFLDIEMEGFTGIQFIKTLQYKPKIILTTAYDKYAIEAFNLNVTDYLLKPISFERFLQAVDKISDNIPSQNSEIDSNRILKKSIRRNFFFIKTDYKTVRVDFKDILYIEGMREYVRIYTNEDRIITLMTFKELLEQLPNKNFIRVHKSYIVAVDKIESILKHRIYIKDKIIPIGNHYKEGFYESLKGK